jgi:sister-chromatid-cohesion protein PDS5
MEYSRTDEKSLAGTAHEMLRDISTHSPEVLKSHVQEICKLLQDDAPNASKANDAGAVDNLKACASYAAKYSKEIPKDRKFVQAMTNFALYGTPAEAAKYAVTIIMTASDRKEMLAKDLVHKCVKGFEYGAEGFLSRLATISQLMLLAPTQVNQESDAISDIAIEEILLKVRTEITDASASYEWSPTLDAECEAKCWALKILVNRIRSHAEPDTLSEVAEPVYKVLSNLITSRGELLPSKNTPSTHKPHLRLLAARLCLKFCRKKETDSLFPPTAFNALALVAQDSIIQVRSSFLQRLKKYLGQQKLPQRFYTVPFLLAFEPSVSLRSDTTTWIRSRAAQFYALKEQNPSAKANIVMESVFARLISLLAHHPDFDSGAEDLIDFARYILFYLHSVATEENLSLIYHIAQRVKQMRDAIIPSAKYDDNLYHLSDLAQLVIRKFEDAHSWSIQTLPGKVRLPHSLFTEVRDHEEAQQIAERNYLPEGVEEGVEGLVKTSMRAAKNRGKRRKSEGHENGDERSSKRAKQLPIRKGPGKEKRVKAPGTAKTPKTKKRKSDEEVASSERRRSGRVNVSGGRYAERDDDEDDEEMGEGVAAWEYENGAIVNMDGEVIDEDGTSDGDEEEAEDAEEEKEPTPKPTPKPSPKRAASAAKGGSKARKGR